MQADTPPEGDTPVQYSPDVEPEASSLIRSEHTRGVDRSRRSGLVASLGSKYGLIFAWLVMFLVFSALTPSTFFTLSNIQTILGSQAVLLMVSLALTAAMVVGEFDVSVSGMLGVSVVIVGYLNVTKGWPILPTILLTLAFGVAIGFVNAFFIVKIGLNSFIVTLGTSTVLLGLAVGINYAQITGISDIWVSAMHSRLLGLSLIFFWGLLLTFGLWYVLSYTPLGRNMFFIGASQNVARLSGIRVERIRVGALVASATIAAFAGCCFSGFIAGAGPSLGASFMLPAFAATFLGATCITPGRFNAWGTFVAVYFLITGISGLEQLGLTGWVENVFYGASLVVAVTFSHLAGMLRNRAGKGV